MKNKEYNLKTLLHDADGYLAEEEGLMRLYKDRERYEEYVAQKQRVGGMRFMVDLIRIFMEKENVY